MSRITNRIRREMAKDPMRRVKEEQVLPEWLSGVGIWIAGAVVLVGLGFMIWSGATSDGPDETVTVAEEPADPIEVNPHETEESEEPGAETTAPETPAGDEDDPSTGPTPQETPSKDYREADFTAEELVTLPVETASADSKAPEGAVNAAGAGALGLTTGDWTGAPASSTPSDDRYLGATVDWGTLRLTSVIDDPADQKQSFTFLFDATLEDGTATTFSVTTRWADNGYEVVIF